MHFFVQTANLPLPVWNITKNRCCRFPLSKYPVPHYADYFKDRDPRMKMTLYTPGDAWPGGDDGDAGNRVNATFGLPRFASLQGNNNNGANTKTGFYFKNIILRVGRSDRPRSQ